VRLLIYGMQSSGASALAFLLGQKPDCAAFVDIWATYAAPALPGSHDVVAKVVVTTAFPLELHKDRFRPDLTLLCLRHPVANYRSLVTKDYQNHCGFIEEKFALLDDVFSRRSMFDAVIHYEDLISDPIATLAPVTELGWQCEPDLRAPRRTGLDIIRTNEARYGLLPIRLKYGMGGLRGGPIGSEYAGLIDLADASCPVRGWCPEVSRHYDSLMASNAGKWQPAHRAFELT
jgi:hypothetical protein